MVGLYNLVWSIVCFVLGIGGSIGSIALFMASHQYFGVVVLMLALTFYRVGYDQIKAFLSKRKSDSFMQSAADDVIDDIDYMFEMVGRDVLNHHWPDEDMIRNSEKLHSSGIKMLVWGRDDNCFASGIEDEWLTIISNDCMYGFGDDTYTDPHKEYRNIKFSAEEIPLSHREMVDVGQAFSDGVSFGGLAVGAMNASDAIKANSKGGRIVDGGSTYALKFSLYSYSGYAKLIFIKNDLLEEYGKPYIAHDEAIKGKYYTSYLMHTKNCASISKTASQLTDFFKRVAKN